MEPRDTPQQQSRVGSAQPDGERPSSPNVVLIVADDMGFSDAGCYGGEIRTPNLDALAADGVRMSQFYNTARCCPSRASLLTGLHPHQAGIGILVHDDSPEGYAGSLNDRCVTIAEVLGAGGYATALSGKWHVSSSLHEPADSWPGRRGFDDVFGTVDGADSYFQPATLLRGEEPVADFPDDFYFTDAISDNAVRFIEDAGAEPFFCYVAYTAPHWPLHAREEDIATCRGRYDDGWDVLRAARYRKLIDEGVLDPSWGMSPRDPKVPAWSSVPNKEWEARRMEVYAAQVEVMDRGIGRMVDALRRTGRLDNTLIVFLSDNGGCAENLSGGIRFGPTVARSGEPVVYGNVLDLMPGPDTTFASYGRAWANLSNTPFREYKHWVHEGGIATPMVVHWPAGLGRPGVVRRDPHQLPDVMATVLDAAGLEYPDSWPGRDLLPREGTSMLPTWRGASSGPDRLLFWEHEGNAAVRRGRWKLVRRFPGEWELYDMHKDRTELTNLADYHPNLVAELSDAYSEWADRCGVIPREQVLARYERTGQRVPAWVM